MPRKARVVLPRYPHHIVQRGHNRQTVFAEDADYRYYLDTLGEWKLALGCKVYAYCLMTNHVHLIIEPTEDTRTLGLLMKRLAARQTRLVNRLEQRTGSLWESRYKSTPIDTDSYLLACCRYVELNPVRARMVGEPAGHLWPSYRSKVGQAVWGWLDPDPGYLALGDSLEQRQSRYRDWVAAGATGGELGLFRQATQRGQLIGDRRFIDHVEASLARRIEFRGRGRPAKRA